jgi:probable phosphoglycerate mutase
MNQLSGVARLANRYRVMRHGQSKANEAGVIVSRVESDRCGDWGLSELGRRQALAAAEGSGLSAETVICSSDFSRARQTAEIVRARLGAPAVIVTGALRERCFGDLDGTPATNYARVWAADEAGASSTDSGIEPAAAVLDRAAALIADLERRYAGRDILLVSHGDTLQILQAGFLRLDPARHRSVPHLETAEIRELRLAGEPPQADVRLRVYHLSDRIVSDCETLWGGSRPGSIRTMSGKARPPCPAAAIPRRWPAGAWGSSRSAWPTARSSWTAACSTWPSRRSATAWTARWPARSGC